MGKVSSDHTDPAFVSLTVISGISVVSSCAGISLSITAFSLFPYHPVIAAGALTLLASVIIMASAIMMLSFCRNQPRGAHSVSLLALVVQMMCIIAIIIVVVGVSWDFCGKKVDCYIAEMPGNNITDDMKCYKGGAHPNCITDLSYLCAQTPPTVNQTRRAIENIAREFNVSLDRPNVQLRDFIPRFIGTKNCADVYSNCNSMTSTWWGFDNRDDCLDFYSQNKKNFDDSVARFSVLTAAIIEMVTSYFLLFFGVQATGV